MRFTIRSTTALKSVRLLLDREQVHRDDLTKAKKIGSEYSLEVATKVNLNPGVNFLTVEAVNENGSTAVQSETIQYLRRPVRLVVDRMESQLLPKAGPFRPNPQLDLQFRMVVEPEVPGRVRLFGHVEWIDAKDQQVREAVRLLRLRQRLSANPGNPAPGSGRGKSPRI